MPFLAQDAVFRRLSEIADVASLSKEERREYDKSLKHYRDTIAVMHGQWLEGHASGLAEGMEKGHASGLTEGMEKGIEKGMEKGMEKGAEENKRESACRMKADGMPAELIAKYTGLTIEAVNSL